MGGGGGREPIGASGGSLFYCVCAIFARSTMLLIVRGTYTGIYICISTFAVVLLPSAHTRTNHKRTVHRGPIYPILSYHVKYHGVL